MTIFGRLNFLLAEAVSYAFPNIFSEFLDWPEQNEPFDQDKLNAFLQGQYLNANPLDILTGVFLTWGKSKAFPIHFPKLNLLDEVNAPTHMETVTPLLEELICLLECEYDYIFALQKTEAIITKLGLSGILRCFKLRCTVSSTLSFPPSAERLFAAFCARHTLSPTSTSKLSVGARALSKHCLRCSSQFWGEVKGPESKRNDSALAKMRAILSSVAWLNIYVMTHNTHVLEIRNADGYGLRFVEDPSPVLAAAGGAKPSALRLSRIKFRGFLEPQMPDGHAVGWVH